MTTDTILFLILGILILIVGLRVLFRRPGSASSADHPPVRDSGIAQAVSRGPGSADSATSRPTTGRMAAVVPPATPSGQAVESGAESDSAGFDQESPDGPPVAGKASKPASQASGAEGAPSGAPHHTKVAELADGDLTLLIGNFSGPTADRLEAIRLAGARRLEEAVPVLIEALYEADFQISSGAAESLGMIGDPRAIEPLLEVTRRNDARLMSQMPQEEPKKHPSQSPGGEQAPSPSGAGEAKPYNFKEMTVFKIDLLPKEYFQSDGSPIPRKDLVLRGLKDNDQQLRKMAAKAAIGMQDADLVPVLVDTLKNPFEVEAVRFMAAEALGELGDEHVSAPLLEALKDGNAAVRYSAATALSNNRSQEVVLALVGALRDSNEFVRSSVAYALGKIGDPQAMEALFGAVGDEHEEVRFSVAKALGNLGGEQVLGELQDRLKKADKQMKMALIDVMGQLKDERVVDVLRELLRDPDSELCYKASLALMGHDTLDVLDELIDASRRLDKELLQWLGGEGHPGSLPATPTESPLRQANEEFKTFSNFEPGGGAVGGDALEKLRVALRHPSPNVRGCAANALGDFQDPGAVPLLLESLNDSHEYVRSTAVSSLGKLKLPETLEALRKLAQDSSGDVRYALAKALGGFDDPKSEFTLFQMADRDESREVKRAARMALDQKKKVPGQE